jgi:hypothetical protein
MSRCHLSVQPEAKGAASDRNIQPRRVAGDEITGGQEPNDAGGQRRGAIVRRKCLDIYSDWKESC